MDRLFDIGTLPSFLVPFVSLSYSTPTPSYTDSFPESTYYEIGYRDVCLMVSIIAIMAVLRDAARLLVLEPFASWKLTRDWRHSKTTHANGSAKIEASPNAKSNGHVNEKSCLGLAEGSREARRIRHSVIRFAEQGWVFVYYLAQWSFGLYVYINVPKDPWTGYPHTQLPGPVKLYYLVQMSFYLHAVLVLNAEARRKDHWQMNAHHIITIVLMGLSYTYNFTRVGCLITFIMDWCDIILPFAKMLRYLGYQTLCDGAFISFMISWLYTRTYLFTRVVISTSVDAPRILPFDWRPEEGFYFTKEAHMGFMALLISLEILQVFWCYLIFSVAYRVATGQGADDSRSDDEDENGDVKKDR
ncbi:longevity assurance proteins LAG1/LAC1 [Amylostereum chailletii]|nr:longevity assurance proteins LAG1/LAC1 [Amylostereum chailletii]